MDESGAKAGGDHHGSVDAWFSTLYSELHGLAHSALRRSEPITLLDTPALVHESYLKLLQAGGIRASERAQFLSYASHAMRSIVVDFVRRRRAARRGSGETHVPVDSVDAGMAAQDDEIIRINEALRELEKVDARLVKVVEMRYFAGLGEEEIAESLGITERTVRRDWKRARLLLSLALQ